MSNDTKTTIAGAIAGLSAATALGAHAANVGTIFPLACGMISAFAVAFLGYFSNKAAS